MKASISNSRVAIWAGCAGLSLAISACGGNKAEARDPSGASSAAVAGNDGSVTDAPGDREATVQVSKAFRERCGLGDAPQEPPRFDFDRTTLRAQGKNVLDDVARCLTEGPLKGETVTIIGRADSRGSDQYNQDLGASRAAAARNYLAERGVPAERMRLLSRGEQGARGNDEETRAGDRRVDLELGDLKNSPILQGSMLQAESSEAQTETDAASYADTAEGGKPVGGTGSNAGSGTKSGGTKASGSVKASGSASTP